MDPGPESNKDNSFILKNTAPFITLASKFSAVPFKWEISDPARIDSNLFVPSSKLQYFIWQFFAWWTLFYPIYLLISLYLYYQSYLDEGDYLGLALHLGVLVGLSIPFVFRAHHIGSWRAMIQAMNQLLIFVGDINRKTHLTGQQQQYASHWKVVDILILSSYPCIIFGSCCVSAMVLLIPYPKWLWYLHLIPEEYWMSSYWLRSLFFLYELILVSNSWTAYFIEGFFTIFYIDTLSITMNILNRRSDPEICKTFKQVHILKILFDDAFGGLFGLPGIKTICTLTSLLYCSLIILLFGQIPQPVIMFYISGASSCLMLVGIILPIAGNILDKSTRFRSMYDHDYNHQHQDKEGNRRRRCLLLLQTTEFKKEMRSCKPFGIQMGSLYVIQRKTNLHFFDLFFSNWGSILIGFRFIRS